MALDAVVDVVDVVHVLVKHVSLQHATAPLDTATIVRSAGTTAPASVATTTSTSVATSASVATVAAAVTTVATTVTLGISLTFALNLGHLHTFVSFGVILHVSVVNLLVLRENWASSFGPVVLDEFLDEKTDLVLLFLAKSGELLGELRPLELKADIGRQNHCILIRTGGRCGISLRNVDRLSTKKAECSK